MWRAAAGVDWAVAEGRVGGIMRMGTTVVTAATKMAPVDPGTMVPYSVPPMLAPPSRATIAYASPSMRPIKRATTEQDTTQPWPPKSGSWRTRAPCHTPRHAPPGPSPGLYQGIGPGLAHAPHEYEDGHDTAVSLVVVMGPEWGVRGVGGG
jgi:hypothetical protein